MVLPLLNAVPANIYWHLPLMVAVISLVYSATRYDEWALILREAVRWGVKLLFFLCGVAVVLYVVALFI